MRADEIEECFHRQQFLHFQCSVQNIQAFYQRQIEETSEIKK
jgi:hypothetical protein